MSFVVPAFLSALLAATGVSQDFPSSPTVPVLEPTDGTNPKGTVTVETLLGEVGYPARRKGGGFGPALIGQSAIFSSENYPQIAWELGITGTVKVVVDVDGSGIPTGCKTVGKPPAELGGPTCALFLGQARFVPATDRKGRPVKGVYTRTVQWRMDAGPPMPVAAGVTSLTFGFDRDGVQVACTASRPSWEVVDEEDGDLCENSRMFAQMLAAVTPQTNWPEWELHMEVHILPGAEPYWKSLGAGRDVKLLARHGMQLTIDPRGIVSKCDEMEAELKHPMFYAVSNCGVTRRYRYVAAAEAERKLQVVNVVYFRRKDAGKPNT